jgi:acetylornithine/N-succinyldiaminopimelate aminotransferase
MLAMAAVIATLEAIENDGLLANVKAGEIYLRQRLQDSRQVADVHGLGFLLGIEFSDKAAPIHKALLDRKIITGTSSQPSVLILLPPLCLHAEEIDLFVEALRAVTATEE